MNRFRPSAARKATRRKKLSLPRLTAGLVLVATTGAQAQLRLKLDGPPPMPLLNPHTFDAPSRIAQPDVNFFGVVNPRTSTAAGSYSRAKGYEEVLTFRNGCQLRGTLSESKENEILWQRPDASEPLRFPSRAVQLPTANGAAADSPFERAGNLSHTKSPAFAAETRLGQRFCEAAFVGVEFLPLATVAREYLPTFPLSAEADVLVFRNGDELPGTALSGSLQGPVHWRTLYGQTVYFRTERIAGIRLAEKGEHRARPADAPISMAELRTGERLRGDVVALDAGQLRLDHTRLGSVTIQREQLRRLFPNPQSVVLSGDNTREDWRWMTTNPTTHRVEPCGMENLHWVRLDGAYLLRNEAPAVAMPTSFMPGWQHLIPPGLERFEFQFRLSPGARTPSSCAVTLFGGGGITLCVMASYRGLEYVVVDPGERANNRWQHIPLNSKLSDLTVARDFRFLVDTNAGTCHILINGMSILQIGKEVKNRLVKTDYVVRLQPLAAPKSLFFSNLQILPWSGDPPSSSAPDAPSTLLRNGDAMTTAPKGFQEGQWALESDSGPMQLPAAKILVADFGGSTSFGPTAGRIRLVDGSILNVDAAQWANDGLNAHHAILGNIHVPLDALAEIILASEPPGAANAPEGRGSDGDKPIIMRKLDVIVNPPQNRK